MKVKFVNEPSKCGFLISFDLDSSEVDSDIASLHLLQNVVLFNSDSSKSPKKIVLDMVPSEWLLRPVLRQKFNRIYYLPYTGRNLILRFYYNVVMKLLQRIFPSQIEAFNVEGIFFTINRVDDVVLSIQQDGVAGWPASTPVSTPDWFLRLASSEWWLEAIPPTDSSVDNISENKKVEKV